MNTMENFNRNQKGT